MESIYNRLPQSQCMPVMDRPNAFIANRDKLYISPELAKMVYNKMEKKEVLEVATIHQELKTPEEKGEIRLEEELVKKSLHNIASSESGRASTRYKPKADRTVVNIR